jgi:NAD(P)-dependent dehydrogenase (short-subunit alcohol dehydrogenase family)
MVRMTERVWLITGASSGFGRAIAQEALSRGDRVVATARRPETLAPSGFAPYALDPDKADRLWERSLRLLG